MAKKSFTLIPLNLTISPEGISRDEEIFYLSGGPYGPEGSLVYKNKTQPEIERDYQGINKARHLFATYSLEGLSKVVMYLWLGQVTAAFPKSTRAAPSTWVFIHRTKPLLHPGDVGLFPMSIYWKHWRDVLVPILQEQKPDNWLSRETLGVKDVSFRLRHYDYWLPYLTGILRDGFQAAGYLPVDPPRPCSV